MQQQFPEQSLPSRDVCAQIGDIFNHLHSAHKAYSAAADGMANLATLLNPDQYTMILNATILPPIQLVVPGTSVSPLTATQPKQSEATTAAGRLEIINFTKSRILPNPESTAFANIDKNSATCVLATTIYSKLEHQYFDQAMPRINVANAFKCNASQLNKALTGIMYKGGPHHYKLRGPKTATKCTCDTTDPQSTQKKACIEAEDTLSSSSSSSSDLPRGLNL